MHHLSNTVVIRIAAEGIVSPPTVRKVFRGGGSDVSRERVRAACARLGLLGPDAGAGSVSGTDKPEGAAL